MKNLILTIGQVNKLEQTVANLKARSAFDKGIKKYAHFLCCCYRNYKCFNKELALTKSVLLNGAADWSQYSYGGCAFVNDEDIAETLCTVTELKKTDNGRKAPNSRETWLDVQARALHQAANLLISTANKLFE